MSEKNIENSIKDYLDSLYKTTGYYCYYNKNHGSAFTKKGIPDIIGCFKGEFFGIEVKKAGKLNTQTEQQKIHMRNIIKSGGFYILADNLEDVINVFESKIGR